MKDKKRSWDPSQHATTRKALDHGSIKVINSLVLRGKLVGLTSEISTGKEAVIFTGECTGDIVTKFVGEREGPFETEMVPCVIKVFKISTMCFKDRDKYIQNEKRFGSFCKSNSRKLIKMWAEKETRNLRRLNNAGILSPRPLYLKKNVLIMEMILYDRDGIRIKSNTPTVIEKQPIPTDKLINIGPNKTAFEVVAPTLQQSREITADVYDQTISMMNSMYKDAGLVHADFSAYNILINKVGELFVIDVGQAVDTTHENAHCFLIADITNINGFFRSRGIQVRDEAEIFEEVTGLRIPKCIRGIRLNKNSFIPTGLSEIANYEDRELFMREGEQNEIETADLNPISRNFNHKLGNLKIAAKSLDLKREQRRENKKKVKEENKERRMKRVLRKEEHKKS